MKSRLLYTFVLLIIANFGFACSFIFIPFCSTVIEYDHNGVIVIGYITEVDEDGINFEIIDLINGEETSTNIRIWDGTDFDCNGIHSMAASDLGAVGDSLILILPEIDTIQNDWDVIGDYRRPDTYGPTPKLRIKNNKVIGYINYYLDSYDFDDFVIDWNAGENCSMINSSKKTQLNENIKIFPSPALDVIYIETGEFLKNTSVKIYNTRGQEIMTAWINGNNPQISIDNLNAGMYFIQIDGYEPKRIIKL